MGLVVVAEPDLRERMRCIRIVADQTPASAMGAASWPELTQVLDEVPDVGLVLFARSLLGAPDDALVHDVFEGDHQWHGAAVPAFLERWL